MSLLFRIIVTGATFVFSFEAIYWCGILIIQVTGGSESVATLVALAGAIICAVAVWRSAGRPGPVIRRAIKWGLIVGGIGFVGGYFGPIIFDPSANQGPLLGIFMTGPAGFVLGAIGGAISAARLQTADSQ